MRHNLDCNGIQTHKHLVRKRTLNLKKPFFITNKDYLTKENSRLRQVLEDNECQESIISKIFKRFTNNHNFSQKQKQTKVTYIQEEDIRMSINLSYVEGASEKLRRILRSQKIRSTFCTESTL